MDNLYHPDCLVSESKMSQGFCLISPSRNYFATLLSDGSLVVYVSCHFCPMNIIFSSKTTSKGVPPYNIICKNDGNVIIYDAKETPQWATNSWGKGKAPYRLTIQDGGNLVLLDAGGLVTWDAHCGRCD